MSTRGIQFLKKNHIAHQVIKYDHEEKGAEFAARAVDYALDRTVKTLVVTLDGGRFFLVLMPGNRQVSMKKVAKACKAKRAAMADTTTAQRITGYMVGGISPFGTLKSLPVLLEASLQSHQEILINAGQRGTMIKMNPRDIVSALNADMADIAK